MKFFVKVIGLTVFIILVAVSLGMIFLQHRLEKNSATSDKQNLVQKVTQLVEDEEPPPPTPITLIFAGDVMLDRHIRTNAELNGYSSLIDEDLKQLLLSGDFVVYNLEGPITTNQSVSVGSAVGSTNNYLFTFDPAVTDFLSEHNMNVANLGNNHILNFGQSGLEDTYQYLDASDIIYFGNTGPAADFEKRVAFINAQDLQIALVNYNQFTAAGLETALNDLAAATPSADVTVLYAHWGNEYVPENQVLINQAHQFIEAGADIVIGSHPHVVTGKESYQNKQVYYSLGNFIFDQYFEPAVREGLVVKATIDPISQEISYSEFMVDMTKDGKTSLRKITR